MALDEGKEALYKIEVVISWSPFQKQITEYSY